MSETVQIGGKCCQCEREIPAGQPHGIYHSVSYRGDWETPLVIREVTCLPCFSNGRDERERELLSRIDGLLQDMEELRRSAAPH